MVRVVPEYGKGAAHRGYIRFNPVKHGYMVRMGVAGFDILMAGKKARVYSADWVRRIDEHAASGECSIRPMLRRLQLEHTAHYTYAIAD